MHIYNEPDPVECPECHRWWKPSKEPCTEVHVGRGCCHIGDFQLPAPRASALAEDGDPVAVGAAAPLPFPRT